MYVQKNTSVIYFLISNILTLFVYLSSAISGLWHLKESLISIRYVDSDVHLKK
jgi:hypothetical protein